MRSQQEKNVTNAALAPKSIDWLPWGAVLLVIAGACQLLLTNNPRLNWVQGYDPTGCWWLSALCAALPLVVLLGAMAFLRIPAHFAALAGLTTALVLVVTLNHMPVRLALTAGVYGAGYGLFPVCWIILPVIFLYRLTIKADLFDGLRQSLTSVTADSRLQLLLIAFALGALLEGASGFGTPVAVCGAILIGLGFSPLQAAGLALIADTAPVAFGSLGIPVMTLSAVTGLDQLALAKMVAILLVPFCVLIPFWLIWAYAGFRAMVEVWPAALVAGLTFSLSQLVVAFWMGPALVDIIAALLTLVVLVLFLRVWKPKQTMSAGKSEQTVQGKSVSAFRAWMPWGVLSVVLFCWGIPQFSHLLDTHTTVSFHVAGLDRVVFRVPPVVPAATSEPAVYKLNWLTATGTASLIGALLAGVLMKLGWRQMLAAFGETLVSIRFTVLTISAMMALGFITRYAGLDATIGLAFARAGALYPFFGTLIGWLGTASTGSDTSSNVLFGSLQRLTAQQIHVSPVLMCSANTTGGVMAKMVAAPSIVVASTATASYGQEGRILRYVFAHSLALGVLVGVLVYLIAYVSPFTQLLQQ